MPLDSGGNYRMNPAQANTMSGPPSSPAPPTPDDAAKAQTVTLTAVGDGSYQITADMGDGQPPQESNAPDFESAMAQAGQSFGEGDQPASPDSPASSPAASSPAASSAGY